MKRSLVLAIAVAAAVVLAGVALAGGGAANLSSYEWARVRPTTPPSPSMWAPRAGLQAVELRNDLFVMGGRGPFNPFGTQLYADVWKSSDLGRTWSKTADGAWPARGYFGAVRQGDDIVIMGGQNFDTVPNTVPCPPTPSPGPPCFPFIPRSTFFDDVWRSRDGLTWTRMTDDAGWAGRAGLSAVVHRGEIYVLGGSQGDDASTGGTGRVLFNDVWKSRDGKSWAPVTAHAPWAPRAGAAVVVKDGYIYLLGGERGFTCGGNPFCNAQRDLYFNDVWRSRDGAAWERMTPAAGWSSRPGHQCTVVISEIVCFGGYGEPENPTDIWASRDGATWTELDPPASPPWNASPNDARYDFDALTVEGQRAGLRPSIMTFGGDRERFELDPWVNAQRLENDVWRMSPP
jgi:hypothetical protein